MHAKCKQFLFLLTFHDLLCNSILIWFKTKTLFALWSHVQQSNKLLKRFSELYRCKSCECTFLQSVNFFLFSGSKINGMKVNKAKFKCDVFFLITDKNVEEKKCAPVRVSSSDSSRLHVNFFLLSFVCSANHPNTDLLTKWFCNICGEGQYNWYFDVDSPPGVNLNVFHQFVANREHCPFHLN